MRIDVFTGPTYSDPAHPQESREVCENLFAEEMETVSARSRFAKVHYQLCPVPGIDVVVTLPRIGQDEPSVQAMEFTIGRLFVVARYGGEDDYLYEIERSGTSYAMRHEMSPSDGRLVPWRRKLPKPPGSTPGIVKIVTMGDTGKLLMVIGHGFASYLDMDSNSWFPGVQDDAAYGVETNGYFSRLSVRNNELAVSPQFGTREPTITLSETIIPRQSIDDLSWRAFGFRGRNGLMDFIAGDPIEGGDPLTRGVNRLVPFAIDSPAVGNPVPGGQLNVPAEVGDYYGPRGGPSPVVLAGWTPILGRSNIPINEQGIILPADLIAAGNSRVGATGISSWFEYSFVVGMGVPKVYTARFGLSGSGTVAESFTYPRTPPAGGGWTLNNVDVYAFGWSVLPGDTTIDDSRNPFVQSKRVYILISWKKGTDLRAQLLRYDRLPDEATGVYPADSNSRPIGWTPAGTNGTPVLMDFDAMAGNGLSGAFSMDGYGSDLLFLLVRRGGKTDGAITMENAREGSVLNQFVTDAEIPSDTRGIAVRYSEDTTSASTVELWLMGAHTERGFDHHARRFLAYNRYGWDLLQTVERSRAPEKWVSMAELRNRLWIASEVDMDVWDFDGDVIFPFRQGREFVKTGVTAPGTFLQVNNTLIWVGGSLTGGHAVYAMDSSQPRRVSTHMTERFLSANASRLKSARAWAYERNGHVFYGIYVPGANVTWVLDVHTLIWHTRLDGAYGINEMPTEANNYGAAAHARGWDENFVGDARSGRIGMLTDEHTRGFDGEGYQMRRVCTNVQDSDMKELMVPSEYQIDCEVGVGVGGDVLSRNQPEIEICWARDNGPFAVRSRRIGARGVLRNRPRVHKCGACRTWTPAVQTNCGLPVKFFGAFVDLH